MEKHEVTEENAALIWKWLQERGGIAVWNNIDLSRSSQGMTTPRFDADGAPVTKPHWSVSNEPRYIHDPADVVVITETVLETVPIVVRMGTQGLSLKVTDASARNMKRKVAKWQKKHPDKQIWWRPTGDLLGPPTALVMMENEREPLAEFMNRHQLV